MAYMIFNNFTHFYSNDFKSHVLQDYIKLIMHQTLNFNIFNI